MDNLIQRQDAIDALIKWYGGEPSDIGAFENIIEKLPSAQPEIVRCRDCKYYGAVVGFVDDYCHKADWYKKRQLPDDFCSQGERRTDG